MGPSCLLVALFGLVIVARTDSLAEELQNERKPASTAPRLKITFPAHGSTIREPRTLILGEVEAPGIDEFGVTVNGTAVMVADGKFATIASFPTGDLKIVAKLQSEAGVIAETSVSVRSNAERSIMDPGMTAALEGGIPPLEVHFDTFFPTREPILKYEWDVDGDGSADYTGAELAKLIHAYTKPRLYTRGNAGGPSPLGHPKHGDVVVFVYPEDPAKDFIKRIVAVGGDVVEVRNKLLYVNGEQVAEPYAQFAEGLGGQALAPRDNYGPYTVPDEHVFVLGDNRDRSYDSRFWGPVSIDQIKGRAFVIYWSWDGSESRVRWERLGLPIS